MIRAQRGVDASRAVLPRVVRITTRRRARRVRGIFTRMTRRRRPRTDAMRRLPA